MKTYSGSPRHPQFWDSHPAFAGNPPKLLRFKREDFEKTIDWLPPAKQNLARGLFSKEAGSRSPFMTADKTRFNAFLESLSPQEVDTFMNLAHLDKMHMRPEGPSLKPVPKDRGGFTSFSALETRQPAKGEELKTPLGFHEAAPKAGPKDADLYPHPGPKDADLYPHPGAQEKRPPSKTPTQLSTPSGKAEGKPNAESANPKHKTLEEFLAKSETSQNSADSSKPPAPPKNLRFADQVSIRKYPVGESFTPGELYPGSPRDVSFDPKSEPRKYRALTNPEIIPGEPRRETQGQEAPFVLDNPSYPPPPPPKGIMTNHTPGPIKTPLLNIGTKKLALGGAAALGTGAAVGGIVVAALMAGSKNEDSSSSAPAGT